MTILAGAMALRDGESLAPRIADEIRKAISRNPADKVIEHATSSAYLAKVDIGVLDGHGFHVDAEGRASALAGDPLLDAGNAICPPRDDALRLIHSALISKDSGTLARCRGTYCAAQIDPRKRTLTLIGDKTGVRPVYYWVGTDMAVFATSLRILDALSFVPRQMDLRGAIEVACFGYPLGDRTGWKDIFTIMAGEMVRAGPEGVSRDLYWRWDAVPQTRASLAEIAQECHRRFSTAVDIRLHGARATLAFLSGGLDSRAIVTILRQSGVVVHSVNFAQEGTQDHIFGDLIARALETRHHQLARRPINVFDTYNKSEITEWIRAELPVFLNSSNAALMWSGDGGSVGVGHVYLTPAAVEHAQAGRTREALANVLRAGGWGVPNRVFNRKSAAAIAAIPMQGAMEDLARVSCADRGRALHLFLLRNDQRRHLAAHFENIDLERIEFLAPFFDADFLEPILSAPIAGFLRHEFYMEWLRHFPPVATSVPWQAYPGHVPCPLPVPENLRYQWTDGIYDARTRNYMRKARAARASRLLKSKKFPDDIFRRDTIRLVIWMNRMGIDRYGYLLSPLLAMERYIAVDAKST